MTKKILITLPGEGGGELDDSIVEAIREGDPEIVIEKPKFGYDQPIDDRGKQLAALIEQLSEDPKATIIVYAISAGGLVGRYALSSLIHQGKPHRVVRFIARDSPILGAIVPLCFQFLVRFLGIFVGDDVKEHLAKKTTKQLLIYYHETEDTVLDDSGNRRITVTYQAASNPLHKELMLELESFEAGRSWMPGIHTVGISNGSTENNFEEHDFVNMKVFSKTILGKVDHVTFVLRRLTEGTTTHIIDFGLPSWVRLLLPKPYNELASLNVSIKGHYEQWENAPGGYSSLAQDNGKLIRSAAATISTIIDRYVPGVNVMSNTKINYPNCFIPTVSALGLRDKSPMWVKDKSEPEILAASMFDEIRYQAENESHGHKNQEFIVEKILEGFGGS